MEQVTPAHIWATLSTISSDSVSTEKFGGITYVKWMAAHAIMMKHFPQYTWEFLQDEHGKHTHFFPDKTCEVRCRVAVGDVSHTTTLPVYGKSNTAQPNPNAHQVNTAKQRCRVKALAEFGLFHHMWSDLPLEEPDAPTAADPKPEAVTQTPEERLAGYYELHREKLFSVTSTEDMKVKWARFENSVRNLKVDITEDQLAELAKEYREDLKALKKNQKAKK
jgi:hypothetical protein